MLRSVLVLSSQSKISRGLPPKNFRDQKHAKFGSILVNFKLRRQISLERTKIFKIGQVHFLPR